MVSHWKGVQKASAHQTCDKCPPDHRGKLGFLNVSMICVIYDSHTLPQILHQRNWKLQNVFELPNITDAVWKKESCNDQRSQNVA